MSRRRAAKHFNISRDGSVALSLSGKALDMKTSSFVCAGPRYKRLRFPAEIIAHAVWLYDRFPLSLRHVEDLLAERGINVSLQTVSEWVAKFGSEFAASLRRRSKGSFADKRHHR